MTKEELAGKVAIVTGGAQGMGKEIADRLSEAGLKVVICDLDKKKPLGVCRTLNKHGNRVSSNYERTICFCGPGHPDVIAT